MNTLPEFTTYFEHAGRNVELRRECMERAQKAEGSQRRFLVECARTHNRVAVDYRRMGRHGLEQMLAHATWRVA